MKLLFCPDCNDLFKLSFEVRSCKCGKVKGRYDSNGGTAIVNGEGVSLAISNPDLARAVHCLRSNKNVECLDKYDQPTSWNVECWTRPHSGDWNNRTRVEKDLQ